ncbi:MAG TPA: cation transporter [Gaiellaceae bacterium]|nr:cation transporter [Gaiellaceae bacterium]
MPTVSETVRVRGIRCERCMARLGHVLKGHEGLESANATLAGDVTLVYDDSVTSREALLKDMDRGGFRELDPVA